MPRGPSYDREVAGIGRAAVLIRLGRHAEAAIACHSLVANLRSVGMWPQLWTVLRLAAEPLVGLGNAEGAAGGYGLGTEGGPGVRLELVADAGFRDPPWLPTPPSISS